ncbi:MAG: LysR family transcriptional regulator [Hyphomicrobiales bacterium]|nr:LysR family transcriptional regulator [Hyphomicrobiales bacterium]
MARDPSWHLYRSLLAVVREGSLSAAARRLKLTQPTIGRHIEELEADLGRALFTRSQTGLSPTPAALAAVPLAEAMEAAAAAVVRAAERGASEAEGTVRITASEVMGCEVLPPLLAAIRREHPRIIFELMLSNRHDNLLRRDADIAVRMGRPAQAALLARRIGEVRIGFYAHKDLIARAGTPTSLDDLRKFDLIGFDRDDVSARAVIKGSFAIDRSWFSFRADSDVAQMAAVRAGLGIGVMQIGIAQRTSELVPVLADAFSFTLEMWLAMHEDHREDGPVRLVYDGLARALEGWLRQSGNPTPPGGST